MHPASRRKAIDDGGGVGTTIGHDVGERDPLRAAGKRDTGFRQGAFQQRNPGRRRRRVEGHCAGWPVVPLLLKTIKSSSGSESGTKSQTRAARSAREQVGMAAKGVPPADAPTVEGHFGHAEVGDFLQPVGRSRRAARSIRSANRSTRSSPAASSCSPFGQFQRGACGSCRMACSTPARAA